MSKVFFSHAIGAARLPFAAARQPSTASSRHWDSLAEAYRDGLVACGEVVQPVLRPEIYQAAVARDCLGVSPGDWHLAAKPLEHIRPFHAMDNVFVSDWPFPALSNRTGGISPFFNQVRLLQQAAAVACCTEATADTLRRGGVGRAIHAPPFRRARTNPDAPPFRPVRAVCSVMAAVELDLLRRWHVPLLEGFAAARAQDGRLRLVLAVSGAEGRSPAQLRGEILTAAGIDPTDPAIAVEPGPVGDLLARSDRPDLFLCQGVPFGLPLALIDAAMAGLCLIAPRAGAAAIGLSPRAFIPLDTKPVPVTAQDEPVAQVMALVHEAPTAEAVRDALLAAAALDGEGRAAFARAGRAAVEEGFGLGAFRAGLRRLAAFLTRDGHDGV